MFHKEEVCYLHFELFKLCIYLPSATMLNTDCLTHSLPALLLVALCFMACLTLCIGALLPSATSVLASIMAFAAFTIACDTAYSSPSLPVMLLLFFLLLTYSFSLLLLTPHNVTCLVWNNMYGRYWLFVYSICYKYGLPMHLRLYICYIFCHVMQPSNRSVNKQWNT